MPKEKEVGIVEKLLVQIRESKKRTKYKKLPLAQLP
jgi:hypothetical protein